LPFSALQLHKATSTGEPMCTSLESATNWHSPLPTWYDIVTKFVQLMSCLVVSSAGHG
jgi:hypothetical protein